MLLGGDAKVVIHKMKKELAQSMEEMEITIDKKTLETDWL